MKINGRKNIINSLNSFFGIEAEEFELTYSWNLTNSLYKDYLLLSVTFEGEKFFDEDRFIVNAQTSQGIFELHNCKDFIISSTEEIYFWVSNNQTLSCLIVGKHATCSLFANVEQSILENEITEINPAKILASVQLSIINQMRK